MKIGSKKTQDNVAQLVAVGILDLEFTEKLDKQKHLFNFRNLVVDLKTGKSRKRTPEDFVSTVLPYDYSESRDLEKMKQVLQIYCNIFNDEVETLELALRFFGYCLTGETREGKALFLLGPSASNGKTTSLEIFRKCFPIYCKEINKRFFNKNYEKRHKTLVELKLSRLVIIVEWSSDNQDPEEIKSFLVEIRNQLNVNPGQ